MKKLKIVTLSILASSLMLCGAGQIINLNQQQEPTLVRTFYTLGNNSGTGTITIIQGTNIITYRVISARNFVLRK